MKSYEFNEPNKNNPVPFYKHNSFIVYKSETEKYPEMVEIAKGPKWAKPLVGKKYLNLHFALVAIDTLSTENKIASDKKSALKGLESEGFVVEESLESDEIE